MPPRRRRSAQAQDVLPTVDNIPQESNTVTLPKLSQADQELWDAHDKAIDGEDDEVSDDKPDAILA